MQGLIHFLLTQALVDGHSELTTHSGLHIGGEPWNPSIQAHTAALFVTLQILFGPHDEG